jgi:acyl carrier protein
MKETSLEEKILSTVMDVARRRNPSLTAVRREQSLVGELGLDSLDLAQVVAMLEGELGFDPFATSAISQVKTVGDLCEAYARSGR